jgi:SAM-dependent methyltransferase
MSEMTPEAMDALHASVRSLRAHLEASFAERAAAQVTSEMVALTLLRLFLLRQLEACGVSRSPGLSAAWNREGTLELHALAVDLPGLYGERPLDRSLTLSPAAVREVVAILDAPALASAWQDDTTLGWVYQFWNDPQREAIDARVGPRGRIAAHEIASKTQLFTERYMVDWLLQNSAGRIALGMRRAPGEAEAPPSEMFVRGAATLDPSSFPPSLAELRILDPACGSGHFLAGAFDLLVPLYREEARSLGGEISDERIVESILRHNLHGIDIDGRAVQVAAAVLYLKARRLAPGARIPPMNLVATSVEHDGVAGLRGSLMRFRPQQADLFGRRDESTRTDDLGVRFDGDPLGAGQRLRSLLVEGRYDVVVFNPPYLATAKIDLPSAVLAAAYGDSPDLFASFVERAFELCKPEGLIAFVAPSNWMFLSTFQATRERILSGHVLLLAELGKGAFRRASKLIQSAMVVASPRPAEGRLSLAARVGSQDSASASQHQEIVEALQREDRYAPFDPSALARFEGAPLLFWLDPAFVRRYAELPKIDDVAECQGGIATTGNERFLRAVWEVPAEEARAAASDAPGPYLPYLKGAEGREWIEPFRWVLRAERAALELRVLLPGVRLERPTALGVAYTTIGHHFGARLHTVPSIRDVSGASVFSRGDVGVEALVCALNRAAVRDLCAALNPTVNFQIGDVRRLPFDAVEGSAEIVAVLRAAFAEHERGSELSLDYDAPRGTTWPSARAFAQRAVDRPAGDPLPSTNLQAEPPSPWLSLSHALGIALGRFRAEGGIATREDQGLPDGILFLGPEPTSLDHEACRPLREAWEAEGAEIGGGDDLASTLRKSFFAEHRRQYEGRPIHLPLSSARRSYVAYVCFHRLHAETLSILLAAHLVPERRRLEAELGEARARASGDRRLADTQKLLDELNDFIAKVREIAEKGPPPPDGKTPPREVAARWDCALGDGVIVNAAALWPLLDPQWKDPKRWWSELCQARGKKDQDWSTVAARYFPARVRRSCQDDPSLAVAHGCFWALHPASAYAWELRLQDELRPDFALDEIGSDEARARFLAEHGREAREIEARELARRRKAQAAGRAQGP